MAEPSVITVSSAEELQQRTLTYIAQGYTVVTQTPTAVVLIKKKEINWLWVALGMWCIVPLIVYMIKYSRQTDSVVEIRIVAQPAGQHGAGAVPGAMGSALAPPEDPSRPQLSSDGTMWWDGTQWIRR